MTSMAVYEKVASGEISPERGAAILLQEQGTPSWKPIWLPRWAFVVLVVLFSVVLAPIISVDDRERRA